MTDLEKNILKCSKELTDETVKTTLWEEVNKIIENEDFKALAPEDKAGLIAVISLRASLVLENSKGAEPKALWRFVRYLTENEMPMQIIDYSAMLWPGNDPYFSKTLPPTAFKLIQQQASLMLENEKYEDEKHKEWLEKIANGQLPYGYSIQVVRRDENEVKQNG